MHQLLLPTRPGLHACMSNGTHTHDCVLDMQTSTAGAITANPQHACLGLDRLVDDLKGRDPVTGQEVVLDDGAGRAHPDLWPAMQAAWGAHHAAKDAAAGNAAGSWATGSAACGCPPVQMRMHIKLCKSRPRVMAKGGWQVAGGGESHDRGQALVKSVG